MRERVRICDIAEELGLSTATVSNVIHGKTNKVSDETVQRVTALLEKRQYIPSMAGILLARNSSGIIGVFVNDHPKYEGHTLRDGFLASALDALFVCEASWSLGENVYAAIYGRIGTEQSAAMTLTAPIQGLAIGALCGLSQAAGVIVGKRLGGEDYDGAYRAAKRLMVYGAVGASVLCAVVLLTSGAYVEIYQVSRTVKRLTRQILFVYALAAPFKVLNMILGGGILRSGGRTAYVMGIDMLGTWGFGVPLGLLGAFVWRLPIASVYLLLSLEECIRFAISMAVFRRKRWMRRLG
ncbi:MAG: MATE family efflux transporter [Oscillospiraceae bacterium]